MTLKNHIKKILREESLSESRHLRRRFDQERLNQEFEESINYASRSPYKFESLEDLKHYVISVMMDGLHGELSNWGSIDFPYDEIYNFLKNEYSDEIEEYDHLIGDNELNESRVNPEVRRRVNKIDKLVDTMLNDMYVDEYDNEKEFFDGLIFELGWFVRNEKFGLHDVDWADIYDYIDQHRRNDINDYYNEHFKDEEINESELTERCWKGYTQKGMKTMFGKRYPNCVKVKKK
jgi:hypothetical protein